ncbi:hypothetical protein Tco_0077577 [Tanacetum coccineum]
MQPVAPPSPNYLPGPEHPPSPDYVPGPKHPPSLVYLPYVLEPEYPEYLAPSDDEAPIEDQPLPADSSPVALLPGYPFDDDDDDDDDEDEEPFEDEDDNEEEEEHLAPADSSAIPVVDHVPSAGDIEAFETNEWHHWPIRVAGIQLSSTSTPCYFIYSHKSVFSMAEMPALERSLALLLSHHGFDRSGTNREKTSSLQTQLTIALGRIETLEARDPEPQDEPAEAGSSSSRMADDSHESGNGGSRQVLLSVSSHYTDFLKCHPMNFKALKELLDMTNGTFRHEYCILLVPMEDFGRKMYRLNTAKGGEIKKLVNEMWNLKVKVTDVVGYNQRFLELALIRLCDRMFPKELDEIDKYVGGLPDMIYGSVKASKPKTMQEAIEFATEMME